MAISASMPQPLNSKYEPRWRLSLRSHYAPLAEAEGKTLISTGEEAGREGGGDLLVSDPGPILEGRISRI